MPRTAHRRTPRPPISGAGAAPTDHDATQGTAEKQPPRWDARAPLDAEHTNQQQSIRRWALYPAPRLALARIRIEVRSRCETHRHERKRNGDTDLNDGTGVGKCGLGLRAPTFPRAVVVAASIVTCLPVLREVVVLPTIVRLVAVAVAVRQSRRIAQIGGRQLTARIERAAAQHLPNDQKRSQDSSHQQVASPRALRSHASGCIPSASGLATSSSAYPTPAWAPGTRVRGVRSRAWLQGTHTPCEDSLMAGTAPRGTVNEERTTA